MLKRTLSIDDALYQYILAHSLRESGVLRRLRDETARHEYAIMQIAPEQGQFMALLVELLGVRRAIEVGVFTGYSALAVALALPDDGELVACDVSEEWTSTARQYWEEAKVAHKIDLRLAPATDTLMELIKDGQRNRFDFAFIDADKTNYDRYYELCLDLIKPGGVMVVDNVLWGGAVADDADQSVDTRAIRALNNKIHHDHRVSMSLIPIADGLTLIRKR
jgi:caffeoyl-CoA O-methyltransferase